MTSVDCRFAGATRRMSCWLILLTASQLVAQPANTPGYKPIYSRERSFRIPYDVNAADRARLKEVQLGFSTDRGAIWKPYASGAVPQGRDFFTFTASSDGEYWFSVRTVDMDGRGDPPTLQGTAPQLVVIVDTTPPLVDFRGLNPNGDEAGATWEIQDPNLDLRTLRMEFRASSADWFPINIQQVAAGNTRFKTGTRGPVQLRLRVLDLSGNETTQEISLQPATGGQSFSPPASGLPAFGAPPVAAGDGSFAVPPPPNFSVPLGQNGGLVPPAPGAAGAPPWTPIPGSAPAMPKSPSGVGPFSGATTNNVPLSQTPLGQGPVAPGGGPIMPPLGPTAEPGPGRPTTTQGQLVSQAVPPSPPVRQNLQLVNSTKFEINYDLEEVGRSGVSVVGLYWTYDGVTWNYHGDDEDQKSPFQVEVDAEGVFGFKLVARSGAGLGDDPPRAGDQPDVWVEVDITPPEVDLRPPQPGRGTSSGILDIEWQSRDKNPAPKPIRLLYAEVSTGPWIPIADGIENSGKFQWEIPNDPKMPYKFFVRLECRDRAGNVGRAETPTPVVVDLMKPKIKILRVEPAVRAATPDLSLDGVK
ncbi:hypothetical protein K2X85_06385 [bacterium]|nr:hypothetical protein [bacterium]